MKTFGIFAAIGTCVFVFAQPAGAVNAVLKPVSGPPSMSVTATGTGFDASTLIDVFFDTTEIQLATSKSTGGVTVTFPIPTDAQPGVHWVTLSERRTYAAAQASFNVFVNWAQTGFGPSKRGFNPYENTIGYNNVAQLTRLWSSPLDGFGNSKPPIVYQNNIYVRDADQVVRAFSPAGKLLWKASTPFQMFPDALTPAATAGKVFFATLTGDVIAYPYRCHTDGSTCAPAWARHLGSAVAGGLTLWNNLLYAPAADGMVHVLDPATGKLKPSILAASSALTSWIAFSADGSGYVARGQNMVETAAGSHGTSDDPYGLNLSAPVAGNETAYSTDSADNVREVQFGWTAPLGAGSCIFQLPPVFVGATVYAAGCASLGGYDATSGSQIWSLTIPSNSQGLSYANGILYTCIAGRVIAYSSYGGRMWGGGRCSTAPVIANGVLYVTAGDLNAYTLNGAQTTVRMKRPDPRSLRPLFH
ncbi:MAG TPA: PQQ-binding-like beta-propeller repeat protein [Rhizomicrobium sp.]